jgi:hypothetical protein
VAVVKSGPASVAPGGSVSFTLVVSQQRTGGGERRGGDRRGGAELHRDHGDLRLGERRRGVSAGADGGAVAGGLAIPTLPSGGRVTLTLSGTAGASGSIANVATVARRRE